MSKEPDLFLRQTGRELSRIVFSREEIRRRVSAMALEISEAYDSDDEILILGLLKGSFIFLADLVREIQHPLQVDFLVASSYGNTMRSSGDVRLLYDPEASLTGRSVILVEDIIDSGATLNRLVRCWRREGLGAWRSAHFCTSEWRALTGSLGGLASMPLWNSWWVTAWTTARTFAISPSSGACSGQVPR
jgi:hypoxanthine phosphoribosyltransferase